MPLLSFEVYSNYEEVIRLRSEITMLENRLKSFNPGTSTTAIRAVEAQLQSARAKFKGLAMDAAQAGAALELNIRKGANGAIAAINDLQQKLSNPIQGLTQIAGVAGLGLFLENVSRIRGEFQLMETNINTLLGSAEKGQAMMADLTEYAKESPLDFKGTVGAAQMMLGFGIDQTKILTFMKALGDASMGNAQRFQSLTLAFSQMSAAGKLMGQDLLQMVNAGFQPLDQLAKDTGKSIGQLKEEMSQGKISAEMVQQAFINATSEGGKFYNMSKSATETISGQTSMLGDAIDLMFNDLGKHSEDAIIKVIQGATWMVENYEKLGGVLGTAIAAFGIYKASAMASEFAIKAASEERSKAVVQGFEEEIAKLEEYQRQRALMAFDEDVRSAIETGSISSEMAEKIQAMREEVKIRKEAAEAAVESAEAEVLAANDGVKAAQEKLAKVHDLVDTAEQIGDANEKASAAAELLSAQMEYNAAAINLLNAETGLNTAQQELNTAATQANAIAEIQQTNATNANTVAQNTNTVATGRGRIATALSTAGNKVATVAQYAYTTAINACSKAWQSLKVAFATNPFGFIITALTTVVGLFMTLKDETEETTAMFERFGESTLKLKNNIDTLYAVMNSVNKESKVSNDAVDELIKKAEEYGIHIDKEKNKIEQLNAVREQMNQRLMAEGQARQAANRIVTIQDKKDAEIASFKDEMEEIIKSDSTGEARSDEVSEILADTIAGTVESKKKELTEMIELLERAEKDYSANVSYDRNGIMHENALAIKARQDIERLQKEIARTADMDAKALAKEMGFAEHYAINFKDTSKLVSELIKKTGTLDKLTMNVQAQAEGAADATKRASAAKPAVDYSTFDAKKLTEELAKVSKEVDEINANPVKPLADPINIHSLIETAQKAQDKIGDVDASSATPSTDNSALDETAQKGQDAEDKLKNIDDTTATPIIDTKYLDIALSTLDKIKITLKEVGGQVLNTTAVEREQLKALTDKYGTIGVGTKMAKEDYDLYSRIQANARLRSNFRFGGKDYQLNAEQSAIVQQFMDRYNTTKLSESIMSEVDKRLFRQLKNDLLVEAYNTNKSDRTEALKSITDNYDKLIKDAKSTEDFDSIRNAINAQMKKEDQNSDLYKKLEKRLKALDKRDKSKSKGNGDPGQRAYELRKMQLENERTTADLLQKERNCQREIEIAQMEDNSAKEIATIKFNAEKKRQALLKEAQKEAQTLENNALQEWIKGGNNRKEYQYYAQFSNEQLTERREEYLRQAKERVGFDSQNELITIDESKSLEERFKEDFSAMRDYLKEYGSFQQKKLAIEEEYAEKIRKAQNNGEEMTLTAQRDTELRNLETKAITSQIDWYSVFDNVGVIMRGQLKLLYAQLQEYVKSTEFKKSGAENRQTVINAMDKIRTQLGTNDSWKDLSSALADYQTALNELRKATENDTKVSEELARLTEAKNTAESTLGKARSSTDTTPAQLKEYTESVETAQLALDHYSAIVAENNKVLQEAQARVQSSGTLLSMTAKNVMQPVSEIYTFLSGVGLSQLAELWGAFDELKGGIDGLKALKNIGKDTKDLKDGMSEAGATIAKELPAELTEGLGKVGLIGQIIAAVMKILDILKDGVGTLISSILDSMFNAVSGIIDNILNIKNGLFRQIGESLYTGILGILRSIFTVGGLFNWLGNSEAIRTLKKT